MVQSFPSSHLDTPKINHLTDPFSSCPLGLDALLAAKDTKIWFHRHVKVIDMTSTKPNNGEWTSIPHLYNNLIRAFERLPNVTVDRVNSYVNSRLEKSAGNNFDSIFASFTEPPPMRGFVK